MKPSKYYYLTSLSTIILLAFIMVSCNVEQQIKEPLSISTSPYLNYHDSAQYVGMQPCLECHYPIYQSYMLTGMGRSFGKATPKISDAKIAADSLIYDLNSNFYYQPFWRDSTLYIKKFRLENTDTIHQRTERIDYIVDSGNHTNSHILSINGYLYQIPLHLLHPAAAHESSSRF